MRLIISPEVALEDLRAFVEDVRSEPPRDYDSLQIILREEHAVPSALALIAITNRTEGWDSSYQTVDTASLRGRLPGSERVRSLSISRISYDQRETDIVEVTAHRKRGVFGIGRLPTEQIMLHGPGTNLFDFARLGDRFYRPGNIKVAEKFREWGDEEFRKAQEGSGSYGAAIGIHLAAIHPEQQAQRAISNFVQITTRLVDGVVNAVEQNRD